MPVKNIEFFIITDLHLGKSKKTKKLVENLIVFFNTNKKLKDVDVIVLDGDTFDKLLTPNSEDYKLSMQFLGFLVVFCLRNKIKLRILEGTPSHDNKQINAISELFNSELDYRYISTIEVEYMKEFDKHILYVPDKMKDSGLEVQEVISNVMIDKGIARVDLVFAHGNFKHQLPVPLKSELDENFFLDITNYYIVIGHIHQRSIYKRIIAPGSFDRLEVNNESSKGGVLLSIGKDIDSSTFSFIENTNAIRYDTLDLTKLTSKEVFNKIKRHAVINSYTSYDHMRIQVDSKEIFLEVKNRLIEDGYMFTVDIHDIKIKTKVDIVSKDILLSESFEINKDNIEKLLSARPNIQQLNDDDRSKLFNIICNI